jgi:hypothetical protein
MIEPNDHNNEKNLIMIVISVNVVNAKSLDDQKENKKNPMVKVINNQIEIVMNENISLLLDEMMSTRKSNHQNLPNIFD